MFFCCCAKPRKEDEDGMDPMGSKLKNINRILIEFVTEESKLGMRDVPCIELIEKILLASNKGEVPKKEIIQIYKSNDSVNQNVIKNFLVQEFFFTDNTRQKYDFNKIVLFNLLYSGGKDVEKSNFLFNVLENTSSSCVHNHSQKLTSTVEHLTYIPCIVVGETLNSARRFQSDDDDQDFQELLSLYATNSNMIKEFANHIISMYLFPSSEEKQYLMRQDFLKKMEDCNYIFVKPHEIRKKYTEYVLQNRARAMLPQKLLRNTNQEEMKQDESNEKISRRNTNKEHQSQKSKKKKQISNDKTSKKKSSNQQQNNEEQDPMNKTISDRSMILYRYEDKSRASQYSRGTKNRATPINNAEFSNIQSPSQRGSSRQSEENQKQTHTVRQVNSTTYVRETNESINSFSYHNLKKYPNVFLYLKELFGEQFVQFVNDMQTPFDISREQILQTHLDELRAGRKTLDFPDYNSYPYHVREIFEYFKALVPKDDLLAFADGKLYKENVINLYLKILEKTNLVLRSTYNYHKAMTRNSTDIHSIQNTPQRILYFNTNFAKRLNNQQFLKDCIGQLKDFFKYDAVILPFFFDEQDDKRTLAVVIRVATSTVDLYDREREMDNHDISDTVLHMMDLASHIIETEFNEDQIDGGVEGVCVGSDEDMIIAVCHIAECLTLNRPVDMETFNLRQERLRITEAFLKLLDFN